MNEHERKLGEIGKLLAEVFTPEEVKAVVDKAVDDAKRRRDAMQRFRVIPGGRR